MKLLMNALLKFTCGLLLVGCLLFLPAGTLNYWGGWLLMGLLFVPMLIAGFVMLFKAPAFLTRRLDVKESCEEIRDYMNRYLPDAIAVREVKEAGERFHARYNAIGKTYRYTCFVGDVKPVFDRRYVTMLDYKVDVEKMRQAAAILTGEHDFRSFCGNPRMKKSTVRLVDSITIEQNKDRIHFTFHGTGFLQNMVRILVGTMLEVGRGYWEADYVQTILDAKDRKLAGPTAPPEGLCLMKVDY